MSSPKPTLAAWRRMRSELDSLRKVDPLNISVTRDLQDKMAAFLVLNAEHLLDMALAHAESTQCQSCWGHGYTVEWLAPAGRDDGGGQTQ